MQYDNSVEHTSKRLMLYDPIVKRLNMQYDNNVALTNKALVQYENSINTITKKG